MNQWDRTGDIQKMEENNKHENDMEQPQPEDKKKKLKSVLREIKERVLGAIFLAAITFFTIKGVQVIVHGIQKHKTQAVSEAKSQSPPIRWSDYENLISPSDQDVADFLRDTDVDRSFLKKLDELLGKPLTINRPYNIVWDGDSTALAKRYIAFLQMPLDLGSRQAGKLVEGLKRNAELRKHFFEWIADCIRINNHCFHINDDYWMQENEYDAVIGRVVNHLKQYLKLDGLHYDRIYEELCKSNGMVEWFDSPYHIVEVDSMYYCATKTVESPYRHFEVFVYRLVEEYGVDAASLYRWLDDCPLLGENYEASMKAEAVLPPPPKVVSEAFFDQDGDTIWLSDVAMEWVVELGDAVKAGFDNWDEEIINHLELGAIIDDYFYHYCHLESDFVVREIEKMMMQPQLFSALEEWMKPTVTALLKDFGDKEKQLICESFTHLLEYLNNGAYERDLEYERIVGPVEVGFAIEYAPEDFVVIDGEVYEGLGGNPYRWDEVRLFVALQCGGDRTRFEKLIKETMEVLSFHDNK